MGKVKQRQKHHNHHDNPSRGGKNVLRRQHSQKVSSNLKTKLLSKSKSTGKTRVQGQQQKRPKIPFFENDQILLVGEAASNANMSWVSGDFSFSHSLAQHYKVRKILTTSFDTLDELEKKYPDIQHTLSRLEISPPVQAASISQKHDDIEYETGWTGFSPTESSETFKDKHLTKSKIENVTLLHGIDATKLSTAHKKALKRHAPFTKIVFNFPHVGGLSTDVNRQVRSNQELLVGFFKAAKPLLATPSSRARKLEPENSESDEADEYGSLESDNTISSDGQILVTIFEGEPYTLWNIRDLARHCGLQVVESFQFPWSAYPGYKHARTIGDIKSGKDRSEEGKRRGAWRGEERDARCYVLSLKDVGKQLQQNGNQKRKQGSEDDDNDSD